MKLNLILNGEPLTGYTNVDPYGFNNSDKVVADLRNLDDVVDDAEAEEIIAEDVIDFLPLNDIESAINHWIKKLRHGGRIVIGGVDMYEVCKAFSSYSIDLATTNRILHGPQDKPYNERHANFTIIGLSDFLEERGLKILSKRVYGFNLNDVEQRKQFHMFVQAQRP